MQQKEKTALRHSGAVTEAIDRRNSAAREAGLWKTVLERTRDKYAQRYFEGHIELSNLRAVHYNLVAQSSMRTRRVPESNPGPVTRPPVIRAKASLEIALSERGRSRAVIECEAHHAKASAFSMLADRSRELGMESRARAYEARVSLETASARGFEGVIRGYDKKLEDLGVREKKTREEPASLQNSLDRLERAQRHLEDYNKSHAQAMGHLRRSKQLETDIETLEKDSADHPSKPEGREKIEEAIYQRDTAATLAEKETLVAARCYRDFQHEVQTAHKSYEALSLELTGRPLKTISITPDDGGHGKARTQDLVAAEEKSPDAGISKPQESAQTGQPETKYATTSNQPYRKVAVGVVVGQLLRELERGM